MGISADLAMFRAELNAAVDWAMVSFVASAAEDALAEAVQTEVYDKYPHPKEYVRRGKNGGLIEKSPENVEENYDPETKTLTLRNVNRDDETGRLVAPIVESGEGYYFDFEFNHVPRPFHSAAEQNMGDGRFERALEEGLLWRGFTAKKV